MGPEEDPIEVRLRITLGILRDIYILVRDERDEQILAAIREAGKKVAEALELRRAPT